MLQVIPTASEEDSTVSEKSFPLLRLTQVEARLAEHRDRELKYCEKIRVLKFQTESSADCIESLKKELELIKKEKEGLDSKLAGFQTASKDLDSLLESQRLNKNKEGLGYNVVPPPPTQIYAPPKKDMSWKGFPEFADDTIIDYSRPSPTIESNTDDTNRNSFVIETRESSNIITSKHSSKVRGNQRNWNNLESHQLSANFVMKKKACYNCGGIDHLSYDCGKWVKLGRSCPKNINNHKSMQPRPAIHRVDRFPTVDLKFSTTSRRVKTAAPRLNMNSTRPQTTQDLMIILIQRVQRLERELKERTLIHKVDRGRSRSVMAWVPKKRLLSATITLIFKVEDLNLRNNKWYQSLVKSFDQEKNNIQAQQKKKMVKIRSSLENKPCCSKACKKNTKSLNSKNTELTDKLFDAKNMIYHYKLGLAQVEARLAEHRDRQLKYCVKTSRTMFSSSMGVSSI
nr:ubiquitin hydrolase [Tanacetum cinerariifolium]